VTGTATRVKVCGITNARDARLAAAFGVDAIGLIFCESPRRVDVDTARRIVRALPPFVTPVGVFVDAPLDDVLAVAAEVGLGAVQLHGSETPDYVEAVAQRVPVIKAFRVRDAGVLDQCRAYPAASAFLFDAYVEGRMGGTGHAFDWSLLCREEETLGPLPKPWILAGGLRPENVEEAVARCRPYGVDVSSGVEKEPGIKDPEKLRQFILKARRVVA